ncbi:phosphonate ABC transporter ATP-binding protein [Bacillus sp. FJAT-45350]|uniref:phosphonate ABC transporter ATP-binding protein n=1 Tax=Bacillus sp. FJAT-45350 TaxID=2011014 RepID=UPI000BB754B8|nr:phosphonate ABC transporter ATP-binding protein [Bacillus sp. FJAT-45350]
MIRLQDVSVRYKGSKEDALKKLSLSFEKGEFVCVLGKSGAGKSTFIRCINGLQRPISGDVVIDKTSLSSLKEGNLRNVRQNIGMIFQHYHLIPRLSVLHNTLTGTFGKRPPWKNFLGIFTSGEKEKAYEALRAVELEDYHQRRVEALSGGQKQRVGIARALTQEPQIFLGDEPVASLDPSTASKIFQLLKKIHEERELVTIINVHDVQLAKRYATRVIAFKNGTLVFDGKPSELSDEVLDDIYTGYEGFK